MKVGDRIKVNRGNGETFWGEIVEKSDCDTSWLEVVEG